MKPCFLSIFFLTLFFRIEAKDKSDCELRGLKGKVASVTVIEMASSMPFSGCILRPMKNYTYTKQTADMWGHRVTCSYYSIDSVLTEQLTRKYDGQWYVTEIKSEQKDNIQNWRRRYVYDTNGWPIRRYYYNRMDIEQSALQLDSSHLLFLNKIISRYNAEGMMTEEETYNSGDTLLHKRNLPNGLNYRKPSLTKTYDSSKESKKCVIYGDERNSNRYASYLYDTRGRELSVSYYMDSEQTILAGKVTNEYDVNGNLLKRQSDGRNKGRTEYGYNTDNNKISMKVYVWKDSSFIAEREEHYNKEGALTEMIVYQKEGATRNTREYDSRGNLLHSAQYDKDNSLESQTFCKYDEFDKEGNWHKAMIWQDDEGEGNVHLTLREITYQ